MAKCEQEARYERTRCVGSGRKAFYPEVDKLLFDFFKYVTSISVNILHLYCIIQRFYVFAEPSEKSGTVLLTEVCENIY